MWRIQNEMKNASKNKNEESGERLVSKSTRLTQK